MSEIPLDALADVPPLEAAEPLTDAPEALGAPVPPSEPPDGPAPAPEPAVPSEALAAPPAAPLPSVPSSVTFACSFCGRAPSGPTLTIVIDFDRRIVHCGCETA